MTAPRYLPLHLPAEQAYEAWAVQQPILPPRWEALTIKQQIVWHHIARAVLLWYDLNLHEPEVAP